MIITFHGNQYIKLQTGNTVISCNPEASEKGAKTTRFGANIVLATNVYSGSDPRLETNQYGDADPFLIYGPGSYEVDGLSIRGYMGQSTDKFPMEAPETIYLFTFDDMRVVFLGGIIDRSQIPPEFFEAVDEIDLLFVSVPSDSKSDANHVHSLVTSLSPKGVIPIGYTDVKDQDLQAFAKELGAENTSGEEKATLKLKDLPATAMSIFVLKNS